MTPRILSTAWFVVFVSLTAPSYPAAPEFKAGLVTESRTYYRDELQKGGPVRDNGACASFICDTAVAHPVEVQVQRVTVALEGERITAEWHTLMNRWPGMLANDFPLDAHVQAAIRGNELRLVHPDPQCAHSRLSSAPCREWSTGWVRAKIVDRVNSEEDEDERD
jgi:hypothetical protein